MLWLITLLGCDGEGECPDVVVEVVSEEATCPDVTCEATECPDLTCDCPEGAEGGGGRAVVEIYSNKDVSSSACLLLDDPGDCCPIGFSHVGDSETNAVICLEDAP